MVSSKVLHLSLAAHSSLFHINESTDYAGLPAPFLEPLDVTTQFFKEIIDV